MYIQRLAHQHEWMERVGNKGNKVFGEHGPLVQGTAGIQLQLILPIKSISLNFLIFWNELENYFYYFIYFIFYFLDINFFCWLSTRLFLLLLFLFTWPLTYWVIKDWPIPKTVDWWWNAGEEILSTFLEWRKIQMQGKKKNLPAYLEALLLWPYLIEIKLTYFVEGRKGNSHMPG